MEAVNAFFEYIGRTNLFNFVIFLAVFIIIFKKADLSSKLESAKKAIENHIEDSKR